MKKKKGKNIYFEYQELSAREFALSLNDTPDLKSILKCP